MVSCTVILQRHIYRKTSLKSNKLACKFTVWSIPFSKKWVIEMKRLLIDDMRTIEGCVIARDFFSGVRLLQECQWDELLLDHDLGPNSVKYGKEWTGHDVISWLEVNPRYLPGKITLVTSNPVGRQRMEAGIRKLYERQARWEKAGFSCRSIENVRCY